MHLLIALQRRLAVRAPDAVDLAVIGAGLTQPILHVLHDLRRDRLDVGKRRRSLCHGRQRRHHAGKQAAGQDNGIPHGRFPLSGWEPETWNKPNGSQDACGDAVNNRSIGSQTKAICGTFWPANWIIASATGLPPRRW